MRGHFPKRPPRTTNIPSSSSTRPPINEVGECRGHCEGPRTGNGMQGLGSRLATRHLSLSSCPAVGSGERAGRAAQESTERICLRRRLQKGTWDPFSLPCGAAISSAIKPKGYDRWPGATPMHRGDQGGCTRHLGHSAAAPQPKLCHGHPGHARARAGCPWHKMFARCAEPRE